ncbi:MAG: hypothetical protein C0425_09050 [Chlorobiaceae bacterium]|nr:hypothetical protein [Chlorobiaceae bacterium]MBA4310470.1 hypothetical protein [Chlorobiaceae bacterium]
MEKKNITSYAAPVVLTILIFLSNFLDPSILKFGDNNFAVWFVLSTFCFACGWFINKSFGWQFGGKLVFSLTVAAAFISIILVTLFRVYFSAGNALAENMILYTLRNVTLGAMGFFGMSISEIFILNERANTATEKLKIFEEVVKNAKSESELTIQDAKLKAAKILHEAEVQSKNLILKKERIERELREFIQIEKELIKKYEDQ